METSLSSKIVLGSHLTWPSYKRVACIVFQIDQPPYFHIEQQLKPSRWISTGRKFYVRTGVNLTGFTCVNKIGDDV